MSAYIDTHRAVHIPDHQLDQDNTTNCYELYSVFPELDCNQ